MSRRPRRRRRRNKGLPVGAKVAASAVMVLSFFLMAEGLARFVVPAVPEWQGGDQGAVIMVGHPTRLWGMGAGRRQNGGAVANISEIGLREPIPDVPRANGRQRVMILGDSSFFGHGVGDDETIAARLQDTLAARGIDADTINGGIPGYSTEQTRMLLDEVGWDLEPSLLVIGNLWSDNNFDLYRDADLLYTRAAYTKGLASRSAFMRLLASWLAPLRSDSGARIVTWTQDSAFPDSGTRRVLIEDYVANLDQMVRDARDRGIGAMFLAPSNRDTTLDGRNDDQSWTVYFQAQQLVSRCHGVPWVDTLPFFQGRMDQGAVLDDLFIDEMHPTAPGQTLIADGIADALQGAGWPADPLLGKADAPCDTTVLVDPNPGGRSEKMNQLSPQTNLFPQTGRPTGLQDAGTVGGKQLPPGAWLVSGEVVTEHWPVELTVRDVEGRALKNQVLAGPADDIELIIFNGLDRVAIRGLDASERDREVIATPDRATIRLDFTGPAPTPPE